MKITNGHEYSVYAINVCGSKFQNCHLKYRNIIYFFIETIKLFLVIIFRFKLSICFLFVYSSKNLNLYNF